MVLLAVAGSAPRAAGAIGPGPSPQVFTTLRIGDVEEPDSLNPYVGLVESSYSIWSHVYEMLVGFGIDLNSVPALAKSWEVDAAKLNWTFHLQQGVKWHDGVDFTAEDVNFTYRSIWAKTPLNPIGCNLLLFQSYLGDPAKHIGVDVDNITVLDPYTIRIPTFQPKANILTMVIFIVPKHIWSTIDCKMATHVSNLPPIGTGMYKLTTWVRGAYIQLDLNADYWRLDKSQDYVDRIIYTYYKDATALYNAFVGGDIDATDTLAAEQFKLVPSTVGGATSPNVGKFTRDSLHFDEVGACVASDALIAKYGAHGGRNWVLTNLTVRQALQLSVNRIELVDKVLEGLGKPGSTMIPPATLFWHYNVTAAEEYKFDLNRARLLLDDPKGDGYPLKSGFTDPGPYGQNIDPANPKNQDAFIDTNGDGIREVVNPSMVVAGDDWGTSAPNSNQLSFTIAVRNYDMPSQRSALRMEDWWTQIGIKVTTDIVSEARLIGITYACSEDLYIWDWSGDVDPDFLLSVMTTSQILNWQDAWYSNKTYDELYTVQQRQVDPYERQQTIWNMQRILYHDAVYIDMYYPYYFAVVRTDTFTGWGNWSAHPGLGLTGHENDFVMLTLRATTGVPTNQCPTTPIIEGTPPRHVYVNVSSGFTANASDPESDPLTWTFAWYTPAGDVTRVSTGPGVTQASASFAWNKTGVYNVTVSVNDNKCGSYVTSAPFQVIVDPLPTQFGWIAGTVRDGTIPSHPPIAGATVAATKLGTILAYSDTTNATGEYNLTLAVGTYSLVASQALYLPEVRASVDVTQGTMTRIDFLLTQERGYLVGTVTSSAGGALPNATVRVTGPRQAAVETNAQGHYNVTLPPGRYNATASHVDYYNKTRSNLTIVAGQETAADFALDPIPVSAPGLSPLVVAGIGAAVLLVLVGVAAWLIVRRRKKEEIVGPPPTPPGPPGPPGAP